MTERTAILVSRGKEEAERVLRRCADENGGKLVGDPSILSGLTGITIEGVGVVTVIIVEDQADPNGWWDDWNQAHGLVLRLRNI